MLCGALNDQRPVPISSNSRSGYLIRSVIIPGDCAAALTRRSRQKHLLVRDLAGNDSDVSGISITPTDKVRGQFRFGLIKRFRFIRIWRSGDKDSAFAGLAGLQRRKHFSLQSCSVAHTLTPQQSKKHDWIQSTSGQSGHCILRRDSEPGESLRLRGQLRLPARLRRNEIFWP